MADGIRCVRLWTGDDGLSHVEETTIPDGTLAGATGLRFAETAAGGALDWHTAPRRQYVLTLSGTLEFVTRDGERFTLAPGDRVDIVIVRAEEEQTVQVTLGDRRDIAS